MISESYKKQLMETARMLDILLAKGKNAERLVVLLTSEGDEKDKNIRQLANYLGATCKMISSEEQKNAHEKVLKLFCQYLGAIQLEELSHNGKTTNEPSFNELQNELNDLIGLNDVKKQVQRLIKFNMIQKQREQCGLKKVDKTMHLAFLGNPGTGKTSVARIVGQMYRSIGCLSKGHFIEASRTDLIAEYQGQTAVKVKKLVNRAKGGVLFIDEAYSITENNHSDSYGRECLTELTKALEEYRNDLVVIVAGYTKQMDQFFDSNPGLKSRFNNFIVFPDYSNDELFEIFKYICKKNEYVIDNNAEASVKKLLERNEKERGNNFSNGRFVRNVFDDIITNHAMRISLDGDVSKNDLMLLKEDDAVSLLPSVL